MDKKINRFFYKALHLLEYLIAILTVVVLLYLLGLEVFKMCTDNGYFDSADNFLKNILTIVVGLEFVRMLINLTPANTLEVLIVAISRQVIINHDGVSNIICVLCIGGLFAIRRFLVSKNDYKRVFSLEDEDDKEKDADKDV